MVLNNDKKYDTIIKAMDEYTYKWQPDNYDDPTQPILKITKSSLGSFDWCPKKYNFSYVQRLPQDQTEAMRKGTILHVHRENFFNDFDIKKVEHMSADEVHDYCASLTPIDEYFDMSMTVASFEAQRFMDARAEGKIDEYLPVCNEGVFDAEITIEADTNPKFLLRRDYKIHIQGIIDRIFQENGGYVPFEYKTGGWNDGKKTSMRKEMAFYQLLIENAEDEVLIKNGLEPNVPVTHWGWYYPAANYVFAESNRYKNGKLKAKQSVLNNIAKLIHAYENETYPTKFFFKTCSHCSYFSLFDAAEEDSWV
jgi:hypothetical protein